MEIASGNATRSASESGMGSPEVLMVHAGVTDQRSWAQVIAALPDHRRLTYDVVAAVGRLTGPKTDSLRSRMPSPSWTPTAFPQHWLWARRWEVPPPST